MHNLMLEKIELKPLPDEFQLREVQDIGISMLKTEYLKGLRKVLVHMSTGTGKSILAGIIIRMTLEKNPTSYCFFVVPRISLLWQTKKVFSNLFGFDCGIIQGSTPMDLTKHVQLATAQTLTNRLNSKKESFSEMMRSLDVKMYVQDEGHLVFKVIDDVNEHWKCHMLNLSATPFTKGLGAFWQSMVRPKSMVEVMEEGTISGYKVRACVPINRGNLRKSATGEYVEEDVDREVTKIVGDVLREYLNSDDMRGRLVIGFVNSIATCLAMSELFSNAGVSSAFVHSKMSDDDVNDILNAFRSGHYRIVWSVIKLCEGIDIPEVSGIMDCAPLAPSKDDPNIPNSPQRFVQKIGRSTRSYGNVSCTYKKYLYSRG